MTKVSIETRPPYQYTLNDIAEGDFFLDNNKDLCMYIKREIEDLVCCYNFISQRTIRYCNNMEIHYLPNVYITY